MGKNVLLSSHECKITQRISAEKQDWTANVYKNICDVLVMTYIISTIVLEVRCMIIIYIYIYIINN